MKSNQTSLRIMPALVIVLTIGVFATVPAYAYVDPGSGQLLLQALGVVFFGAAFYVRQIVAFFRRMLRRN